jgi:hypothetical protein
MRDGSEPCRGRDAPAPRAPARAYDGLRRKHAKQAEVLVPDRVLPKYIRGAYVSGPAGEDALVALGTGCPVKQRPHLFDGAFILHLRQQVVG